MQEGQPGFPLPAEAWLDELLASIFRMLINLESTDASGKDHVTFLMNDSSLYRSAASLLLGLMRLIPSVLPSGLQPHQLVSTSRASAVTCSSI